MADYAFKIVNVFAEEPFGGNPLAVITDARGLSDDAMQRLARQFNLSETVFLLPAEQGGAARLRIFTPALELPFAGHPTLGSAAVLHRLRSLPDGFMLETNAGIIPIHHHGGLFRLTANAPTQREAALTRQLAARMLGLNEADIAEPPAWLNTGSEQLLIGVSSREAVLRARPDPALFIDHAQLRPGRSIAYLWHAADGVGTVRFFMLQNGAIVEDPGTGSACANLGGWFALNRPGAQALRLTQGESMGRPNVLYLDIDAAARVQVGGRVQPVAEGVLHL